MEISREIKLLTNVEVLECLRECSPENGYTRCGEFPVIRNAVMEYFKNKPVEMITKEKIQAFMAEITEFEKYNNVKFTPNEKMQMINIVPLQPVDIYIIVEQCDERLNENQVDSLVELIRRTLVQYQCLF